MTNHANVKEKRFVILGAGPAGMGAAWELHQRGAKHIIVIDNNDRVGGLARTLEFKGYLFDVGPHRFLTKYEEVEALWKRILGKDLLDRPRVTRIYYRGKFFTYPLKVTDALKNLGVWQSILAGISFIKAKILWHTREPKNFAEWTTKTFGNRLSKAFFRDYTKKVWGIGADEVGVDWAGQRIKPLRLSELFGLVFAKPKVEDIGARYFYPRLGAGMFYERMQQILAEKGVVFLLNQKVTGMLREGFRISAVETTNESGEKQQISGDIFISSIPSNFLVKSLKPPVAEDVQKLTSAMRFRAHIAVNMIVLRKNLLPDSWLYVQSNEFRIARMGNYGNFSPDMLGDPNTSAIGVELFCSAGDDFWNKTDKDIIAQVVDEMVQLGFMRREEFGDAFVVRHAEAYPMHYMGFREAFAKLRAELEKFGNLRLIGRAAMYKYKDQDHAMYTGMLAARNLFGEKHDVWELGEEKEFFEEKAVSQNPKK